MKGDKILARAREIVGPTRYVEGDPDWEDRVQETALALLERARGNGHIDPAAVAKRLRTRQMKLEKSQVAITPRMTGEGRDDRD